MRSRARSGGAGPTTGGSSRRGGAPRAETVAGGGAGAASSSALHTVGRLRCGSEGGRLLCRVGGSSGRQQSGAHARRECSTPSGAASSSCSSSEAQQGWASRAPSMPRHTNTGSAGRSAAHSTKQQITRAHRRRTFSTLQRSRRPGNVNPSPAPPGQARSVQFSPRSPRPRAAPLRHRRYRSRDGRR